MSRIGAFPGATARALLGAMERLGLDLPDLKQRVGPIDESLPASAFTRLWMEAAQQRGDDSLVLEVAQGLTLGSFGPLDLSVVTSATVAEACAALAKILTGVMGEGVRLTFVAQPGGAVRVELLNADSEMIEVTDALLLAVLLVRLREQTTALDVVAVQLTHPRPARPTAWKDFFGAPPRFSASISALVFSASAWRAPLRSANPAIQRALAPLLITGVSVAETVRAHLRNHLGSTYTLEMVAKEMGYSARTLQRRLEREGLSLRSLQCEVRAQEAHRLMSTGQTLAKVAACVGFSSATALSRALKASRKGQVDAGTGSGRHKEGAG